MPGIVGFQDFWVAGSRFFFEEDGQANPHVVDLGTVGTISPTLEPTILDLKDSDGGRENLIDQSFSDINESYEIECNNISSDNLNIFLFGNGRTGVGQLTTYTSSQMQFTLTASDFEAGALSSNSKSNGVDIFITCSPSISCDFKNHRWRGNTRASMMARILILQTMRFCLLPRGLIQSLYARWSIQLGGCRQRDSNQLVQLHASQ